MQSVAQTIRTERATAEAANYECRTSEISGYLVVFVVNTVNRTIYTVRNGRCNCADYLHRCAGNGLCCKHVVLAEAHLEANAPAYDETDEIDSYDLAAEEGNADPRAMELRAQAYADRALWSTVGGRSWPPRLA